MKKFSSGFILVLLLLFPFISHAQYVNIPDANFRAWLNSNGYASCMNGTMMDTTCPAVVNATKVAIYFTQSFSVNLNGLQYFDNLDTLICSGQWPTFSIPHLQASLLYLSFSYGYIPDFPSSLLRIEIYYSNFYGPLPTLPPGLQFLTCCYDKLDSLPALPPTLTYLDCTGNPLHTLPALPAGLIALSCNSDSISSLPAVLPSGLTALHCANNQLTSLPTLPASLGDLTCASNQITSLPSLPNTLSNLDCSRNPITTLPALSSTALTNLYCYNNQLTSLPVLPNTLWNLQCNNNYITSLPAYPASLHWLSCGNNLITNLNPISSLTLWDLDCSYNQLTSLPALDSSLGTLDCSYNQITSLPSLQSIYTLTCDSNPLFSLPPLPSQLSNLSCQNTSISALPDLPDSLALLNISYTPITCLPYIKKITDFIWTGSSLSCLPNVIQVTTATPVISLLSLCQPSGNCPTYWNIKGNVYKDANANCFRDIGEDMLKFIPIKLFSSGVYQQEFLTNYYGDYSFHTINGTYDVKVDTTNLPYDVTCPITFAHTSVITTANSYDSLADFALQCKAGYDLEAKSISPFAQLRPGTTRRVNFVAGDVARYYGSLCTSGLSGIVQAVIDGPASYLSPAPGAVAPSTINGDTITWNVSDFSLSNPTSDFNIIMAVDTFATLGDTVCMQLSVLPLSGDNNISNNTVNACYEIVNSFDPNEKLMSPSGVVDTSQHWFTFTVFFQNTGTFYAENIYILDSLSYYLDASTFTFLSSSHDVVVQMLYPRILRFNFHHIYLLDSTTNESASHGYVQFKIKRNAVMPWVIPIKNKAYIYFDYNPPVVTNTVSATFSISVSIDEKNPGLFTVFPNPSKDAINITGLPFTGNEKTEIILSDVYGNIILSQMVNTLSFTFPTKNLASGVYSLAIKSGQLYENKKLVIQH